MADIGELTGHLTSKEIAIAVITATIDRDHATILDYVEDALQVTHLHEPPQLDGLAGVMLNLADYAAEGYRLAAAAHRHHRERLAAYLEAAGIEPPFDPADTETAAELWARIRTLDRATISRDGGGDEEDPDA
jgi:aspartate aminotransferase-like enzyme